MQARVRFGLSRNPLRRSCVSSARNAGESAIWPVTQPSAEIVRVECAKCRRECDLACHATLCGDRACRVREMQARVRFGLCPRNPLRRSCVSSARNAGSYTHRHRYTHTQRPTHCLNSLDLTLHTEHLTDNSHSDFLRDEKCFRATRRLVFLRLARLLESFEALLVDRIFGLLKYFVVGQKTLVAYTCGISMSNGLFGAPFHAHKYE